MGEPPSSNLERSGRAESQTILRKLGAGALKGRIPYRIAIPRVGSLWSLAIGGCEAETTHKSVPDPDRTAIPDVLPAEPGQSDGAYCNSKATFPTRISEIVA
jgi:hypothetical protein